MNNNKARREICVSYVTMVITDLVAVCNPGARNAPAMVMLTKTPSATVTRNHLCKSVNDVFITRRVISASVVWLASGEMH
jgi:hypothetical protein